MYTSTAPAVHDQLDTSVSLARAATLDAGLTELFDRTFAGFHEYLSSHRSTGMADECRTDEDDEAAAQAAADAEISDDLQAAAWEIDRAVNDLAKRFGTDALVDVMAEHGFIRVAAA